MTLFFNLENLERESCDNTVRFVQILNTIYYKKLPSKRKGVKAVKLNMQGNSFILNPEPLFKEKIDTAYIVQYVKLCGMRDYTMYKHYGIKSLPLSYFPDINMEVIKTNPLIHITKSEIHFKYE